MNPIPKPHLLANSLLIIVLAAIVGLPGCQKDETAENAGKKIDQAAANANAIIEQKTNIANQKIEVAAAALEQKTLQAQTNVDNSLAQAEHQINHATANAEQSIAQTEAKTEKSLEGVKESVMQQAETSANYVDDSVITLKVKAAILNDAALKMSTFEVTTVNGVVKLIGTVDSEQSKTRAIELVKTLEHVIAVETDLTINARLMGE